MLKYDIQRFGGRGASGTGGGRTGGAGNLPVSETTSLLSASGKRTEINQTMRPIKDVYDKYGVDLQDIQIAKMGKGGESTMAYYDSKGNIAINESYFDAKTMNKSYDACVESKFHPSRGNKTGLEATTAHELGHALTEEIGRKMGLGDWKLEEASNKILANAKKSLGAKSVGDMRKSISGYAQKNNAECLAEAFSDVWCNGKKASKTSQAIVNEMNKFFK